MNNHIILIGFKHVGKSVIGEALSRTLRCDFIDLDQVIMQDYVEQYKNSLTCREIMRHHGENFFRELEHQTLKKVMKRPNAVLSLGGGTPLRIENQLFLQSHDIIHITAPQSIVFDRIMSKEKPAFIAPDTDFKTALIHLWNERIPAYQTFATLTVHNDKNITDAVHNIMTRINL